MALFEFITGFMVAAVPGAAAWLSLRKRYSNDAKSIEHTATGWRKVEIPAIKQVTDKGELAGLKSAVSELSGQAKTLAQEIQLTSQQVRAAHNQMETSVQSVADIAGAFKQMQQLAAALGQTSASLENDFLASETAAREVNQAMGRVNEAVLEITGGNKKLKEHIDTLETAVGQVQSIAENIGAISGRTKLLALNAAIEAARAGEHGRGFSVVAEEISKLSDHTAGAVQQAFSVLEEMRQKVDSVVESITGSLNSSTSAAAQIKNAEEILSNSFSIIQRVSTTAGDSLNKANNSLQQTAAVLEARQKDLEAVKNTGRLMHELAENLEQVARDNSLTYIVNQQVTSRVNDLKEIILRAAQQKDIQLMEPNRHKIILSQLKEENIDIEAIWSNDHTGSFIYSEPPAGLATAGVREWWQKAMSGEAFTSPVYISAITRRPCITVSVPIHDGHEVTGVMGADIKLTW